MAKINQSPALQSCHTAGLALHLIEHLYEEAQRPEAAELAAAALRVLPGPGGDGDTGAVWSEAVRTAGARSR